MQNYADRMILPLVGKESIIFSTKSNLVIAYDYDRVVIGDRGPYIEFTKGQLVFKNFHWIDELSHKYYIEYRSNCESNVKLYCQLLQVNYADYRVGKYYISPFDLISDKYPILITPLERKRKK
jgi:hypothetical protein